MKFAIDLKPPLNTEEVLMSQQLQLRIPTEQERPRIEPPILLRPERRLELVMVMADAIEAVYRAEMEAIDENGE